MSEIEVPEILNDLAAAGEQGIDLPQEPARAGGLETLRAWGFTLQCAAGRVCLPRDEDTMVPVWIEEETPALAWSKTEVVGFLQTGSTNDEALRRCRGGAGQGLFVYAETQTSGRGRLSRPWFSPRRAGLYFSLVLRPSRPAKQWTILALTASVALAQTLKELPTRLGGKPVVVDLKWPNDVLISGRKTAGFLIETTEMAGHGRSAVLGCGINVSAGSFPEDLAHRATAVALETGVAVPRRWLAVRFLYHLQIGYNLFELGQQTKILEAWKSLSSMWNGVPISIMEGNRRRSAVTCGLSEDGALLIRTRSGEQETLLAGDVSVRSEKNRG